MSEQAKQFEHDLIKTYRTELWGRFIKAIKRYHLLAEGDKVAVAVSGGKDSLLLAKLFQELQRHPIMKFEVVFISMDPGYSETTRNLLEENARKLAIPLHIESSNIFPVVERIANDYPCYMCARMRRGFLYNMAQQLGCNKLALGHHFNDVIETTMLNILYAGTIRTMLPKLPSENFPGLELIRPLSLVREEDIIRIMKNNNIETMDCGCDIQVCSTSSKRQIVKRFIADLKKDNDDIDKNIYRAAENVDLDGIIGWVENKKKSNRYDK